MNKSYRLKGGNGVEGYRSQAHRYYHNARTFLRKAPTAYGRYQDLKPIREACGIGYLGVLEAAKCYLLGRGVARKDLPKNIEGFTALLNRHAIHNGKLRQAFHGAYEILHRFGYYGEIGKVDFIQSGFEDARYVIETLTGQKIQ